MANRSYTPSAVPIFAGPGSSKTIRNEFASIGAGCAELEGELNVAVKMPGTGPYVYPTQVYASKFLGFDALGNPEFKDGAIEVVAGVGGYPSVIYVDASAEPSVQLIVGEEVVVVKMDDSDIPLEILPPVGGAFPTSGSFFLYNQYEALRFVNKDMTFYTVDGGQTVPFTSAVILPISTSPATTVYATAFGVTQPVTLNPTVDRYLIYRVDDGHLGGMVRIQTPNYPSTTINGGEFYDLTVGGESVELVFYDYGEGTYNWRSF